MAEVSDAIEAERIAKLDLASWFRMPSPDVGLLPSRTFLDLDDLSVRLEGDYWIVAGFAVMRVLMGGGETRTWYGGRRRVEYWTKEIRGEPFLYHIEKTTGRITLVDHNMSTARRH